MNVTAAGTMDAYPRTYDELVQTLTPNERAYVRMLDARAVASSREPVPHQDYDLTREQASSLRERLREIGL